MNEQFYFWETGVIGTRAIPSQKSSLLLYYRQDEAAQVGKRSPSSNLPTSANSSPGTWWDTPRSPPLDPDTGRKRVPPPPCETAMNRPMRQGRAGRAVDACRGGDGPNDTPCRGGGGGEVREKREAKKNRHRGELRRRCMDRQQYVRPTPPSLQTHKLLRAAFEAILITFLTFWTLSYSTIVSLKTSNQCVRGAIAHRESWLSRCNIHVRMD